MNDRTSPVFIQTAKEITDEVGDHILSKISLCTLGKQILDHPKQMNDDATVAGILFYMVVYSLLQLDIIYEKADGFQKSEVLKLE